MEVDHDEKKHSLESIPDSNPAPLTTQSATPDTEKAPQEKLDRNDPGPPPDGGFEAWLVIAGGFCTVFASFGWINCKKSQCFPISRKRLTSPRHRSFPRLLRAQPTEVLLFQHSRVDSLGRILHVVLLGKDGQVHPIQGWKLMLNRDLSLERWRTTWAPGFQSSWALFCTFLVS
jgi:hypothetical protein